MSKIIKISNPILYGFGFIINEKRFSLCVVPGTLDRYGKDASYKTLYRDIVLRQVQKKYPNVSSLSDRYYELGSSREELSYEFQVYLLTSGYYSSYDIPQNQEIPELLKTIREYSDKMVDKILTIVNQATEKIISELDKEFAVKEKLENLLNSLPNAL